MDRADSDTRGVILAHAQAAQIGRLLSRLPAHRPVGEFTNQVGVAVVTGVLLDHMDVDPPEGAGFTASGEAGVVEAPGGGCLPTRLALRLPRRQVSWMLLVWAAGGIPFQADEYDFWYSGARAARDLPGITGKVGDIKKGSVRDGGSFSQRIGHYSSWNSYFTQATYQVKRWNDFLSA